MNTPLLSASSSLLIACLCAFQSPSAIAAATAASTPAKAPRTVTNYGKLPLSFEANQGQTDPHVKFLSRGQGYSLFLTNSTAILSLSKGNNALHNPSEALKGDGFSRRAGDAKKNGAGRSGSSALTESPEGTEPETVRMSLFGSNPSAEATGESELPGKVNYFLGNDPTKWHSNLPTYAKVRYSSVYPGIDLVYYGNQQQLEYDFIVAPGASPAAIRLSFTGQKHLQLSPNGDLILQGTDGQATLHKPVLYQQQNGHRQPIPGSFRLSANNTVTFQLGQYDHSRPLVIDPVFVYSTYLGGSGAVGHGDQGNGIAVDSGGNAYIVGTTYSTDFPVSVIPFQPQSNGGTHSAVFVTKLNAGGTGLIYSTYLGGSGGDSGYGIAIDSAGNTYVTGATYSTDFPVTCGALQTVNYSAPGGTAGFIARLNTAGSALVFSTYLGGTQTATVNQNGSTVPQAIAVGSNQQPVVTGYTTASLFPITPQTAFQATRPAGSGNNPVAFVTRLSADGTGTAYSTFLGGKSGDSGNALLLDSIGNMYIAGSTSSANFPVKDAYQTSLNGYVNAFLTEIDYHGRTLVFSTYLGSFGFDQAFALTLDSAGAIYVGGSTNRSNFPVTDGAVEGSSQVNAGITSYGPIGFLTKFTPGGTALDYSTLVGGNGSSVAGVVVDQNGDAYVTGVANTQGSGGFAGFQTTPDSLPTPASRGTSSFLVKLDPAASVFNYASFVGGNANDGAQAIAIDSAGNTYIAGYANSTNFPTTAGAYQAANLSAHGQSNAFIAKFALQSEDNQTAYPAPLIGPIPTSIANAILGVSCSEIGNPTYDLSISFDIVTGVVGPAPTGRYFVEDSSGFLEPEFTGSWTGTTSVSISDRVMDPTYPVTMGYDGDALYASSSTTVALDPSNIPDCSTSDAGQRQPRTATKNMLAQARPSSSRTQSKAAPFALSPAALSVPISKFTPPVRPSPVAPHSQDEPSLRAQDQPTLSCTNQLPTLAVVLTPLSRTYGSANPTLTYSVVGLAQGDSVTVAPSASADATSPVGSYPITATVTGASLVNYRLRVIPGTLTVTQAPLAVAVTSLSRRYGASNPTFHWNVSGLLNSDVVTATVSNSATPQSLVGAYAFTATLNGGAAGNYMPVVTGALTITPAPLTVHMLPAARVYGTANPGEETVIAMLDGFSISSTYRNGTAQIVDGKLQLINKEGGQAGSVYALSPVTITKFTTTFIFQQSAAQQAFGMTFVLQNQGPTALGGPGGELGYGPTLAPGITPSIAIKFDMFDWGSGGNNTGLYIDGASPIFAPLSLDGTGIDLHSGDAFKVQLSYAGLNLNETITDTITSASFTHVYTDIDLPQILGGDTAYAGFTAGTGYDENAQTSDVLSWAFTTPPTEYTTTGLLNGDVLVVTPQTSATVASPVGIYPLSASVMGGDAANYNVTVVPATLTVRPAPLSLTATSYTSTYGQTPPQPTAYTLKGFVNGDTANVVSGTPGLSTTVTATTPAGYYPIQTGVGTLTAADYTIVPFAQKGVVHVEKAFLTAKADDLVIHQNSPIPPFTYTLTGFVNGDTPVSSVTGTALMRTDARSQTRPGVYPIYMNRGTLYSPNYSFTPVNGTLTILP